MKKIKKFDDGGFTGGRPIGGRYVDSGDGQIFVPDTSAPVADTPVAAGLAPVRGGPISAGLAPVLSDTAGGLQDNINTSELENFPIDIWINTACPGLALDSSKIIDSSSLEK